MPEVSLRASVRPVLARPVLARAVLARAAGWAAAGLAVGGLWALLTPAVRARSESYEQLLAGDATLAALVSAGGVAAGAYGLWRHAGPGATLRFVGALLGSVLASLVAWGSGRLLGAPVLSAVAVLLFWPMAVAMVTVLGSLVATLLTRETY
jgi:hypothetical protein